MHKLIGFASWEDRFADGVARDLQQHEFADAIIFYLVEYSDWTTEPRRIVADACDRRGIRLHWVPLACEEPASNWQRIQQTLSERIQASDEVVVDIATMPRETIWTVFWTVERLHASLEYVYHRPKEYSEEWLSRDPGRPRFVFKIGGIARLEARSALVITAGYDFQRVRQLYRWFEPEVMVVGLQQGSPYRDNERRMAEYKSRFSSESGVRFFDIDAYCADRGYEAIVMACSPLLETHNVVAASLGAKPTAVAFYQLIRERPEIALAYAPSREFNRDYSRGIGESYSGTIVCARTQ